MEYLNREEAYGRFDNFLLYVEDREGLEGRQDSVRLRMAVDRAFPIISRVYIHANERRVGLAARQFDFDFKYPK